MGERYQLTPVAYITYSGIEVIKWIVLLMVDLEKNSFNNRSMFQSEEGKPVSIS